MGEVRQITIAKCDENELNDLRDYLQGVEEVLDSNCHLDEDSHKVNKEIADRVRKFPKRAAFIAPLTLGILLDNYQDKDSDIIQHPKWIMEMIKLLEDMDIYLSEDPKNCISNGSELRKRLSEICKDDES